MAMKVVRQARLELSGGSTPDQLRPHPTIVNPPPLTHPPLGPSNSIHPFTHGCFEAPLPKEKAAMENMQPPPENN